MPGFTSISMYPKLFESMGIPFTELLDRLIRLAMQKQQKEQRYQRTIQPVDWYKDKE